MSCATWQVVFHFFKTLNRFFQALDASKNNYYAKWFGGDPVRTERGNLWIINSNQMVEFSVGFMLHILNPDILLPFGNASDSVVSNNASIICARPLNYLENMSLKWLGCRVCFLSNWKSKPLRYLSCNDWWLDFWQILNQMLTDYHQVKKNLLYNNWICPASNSSTIGTSPISPIFKQIENQFSLLCF